MIKLLAYKSARTNRDTMIMLSFYATADFDRMYHRYHKMLNTKNKIDQTIYKCMLETTEKVTGNMEIGLGMSDVTYEQNRGEKIYDWQDQRKNQMSPRDQIYRRTK